MKLDDFINQYLSIDDALHTARNDTSLTQEKRDGMLLVATQWARALCRNANKRQSEWLVLNHSDFWFTYRGE
jgi:hypothetical protein